MANPLKNDYENANTHTHGSSFLVTRVMCLQYSNILSRVFTMSLKQQSRKLEVTMEVSLRTQELMSCVMNLELDINS